jgi:hypothetical protein
VPISSVTFASGGRRSIQLSYGRILSNLKLIGVVVRLNEDERIPFILHCVYGQAGLAKLIYFCPPILYPADYPTEIQTI